MIDPPRLGFRIEAVSLQAEVRYLPDTFSSFSTIITPDGSRVP